MIKNIIFDFGDIFINLDKKAPFKAMAKFGFAELTPELDDLGKKYEMGLMESTVFIDEMESILKNASREQIKTAWNSIILNFPEHRLAFIEALQKENKYRLFLLSNTNALHIDYVKETMGMERFNRFQNSFEKFYLSYEINMRKPNADIYKYVLAENSLIADETIFIDDTEENINSAALLGIKVWHLQVGKEDIIELKAHL